MPVERVEVALSLVASRCVMLRVSHIVTNCLVRNSGMQWLVSVHVGLEKSPRSGTVMAIELKV